MAVIGSERATQVAEVASRLRMMQIDCAGLSAQERQGFFTDVIEKALASVVPAERAAFLEALQAKFPSWNGQAQPAQVAQAAAGSAPREPVKEPPELRSPRFLVERLAEVLPTLSQDDKRAVAAALTRAGLPAGADGATQVGVPDEVVKWIREILKVPASQRLDASRLLALAPAVLELAAGLHQFVWTAWRTLAPNSELRPSVVNLQAAIARYAAGDPAVTMDHISRELTRLRQLTAAMVAAIGETGRQFATHHCAKFSPNEIEAIVRMEGTSILGGAEKKYWKKYKDLFGELGEDTVEGEIRETIAKHVELLMKGLAR
jgi:hypothetical protein